MAEEQVLSDEVAIVTGAGRNIGRKIAERFAEEGASIVAVDIDSESVQELVEEIENRGEDGIAVSADVSDEEAVRDMVTTAEDAFGSIDILINNAAITDSCSLYELSVDEFDRIVAVNLRGTFLCTREVAKSMRDADGGRIVNVASTSAHRGRSHAVGYATTKSGILNFTRSAARAFAADNIRVNTLSPTRSGSPVGHDDIRTGSPADDILVDRWGIPDDQANAALFLVSPENDFVNGTELLVDGGSLA